MQPVLAGFEDYLPLLIFFVIWWISSKKRKAMRQQPPVSPSNATPKSGKVPTIQEILRQVLVGEVEMPERMEPVSRPRGSTQPADSRYVDFPNLEEESEELPVAGKQPSPTMPQTTDIPASGAAKGQGLSPPRPTGRGKPFAPGRICRRNLRQAVVWSEILAPPVGLRE